ncbi:MAG TPA: hypothetical protein VF292_06845 [Rhodanobacteraceae bacterium]
MIGLLVAASVLTIPPANAHAGNAYHAVHVPASWMPSAAITQAVNAWQASQVVSAERGSANLGKVAPLVVNLQKMYIGEAVQAMRKGAHWRTTEPWIVVHQPMPASCTSPAAKLAAIYAIDFIKHRLVPLRNLQVARTQRQSESGLACSYWVPHARAGGPSVGTKFSFRFVPGAHGMLVGKVLAKITDPAPAPVLSSSAPSAAGGLGKL